MGYQALLFCPDEKTARTVSQVLSELDFTVSLCTEPFAAVKKLMSDRFDAVVVDCDNEQNATLLFKSARNTTTNQSSLAVAVVEGQAGVAKAFRIGANLVLTKPINVEQAKGTVRVARGLLRKSEGSKPAPAGSTLSRPTPPAPSAKPLPQTRIPTLANEHSAERIAPMATASRASIPAQKSVSLPEIAASIPDEIKGIDVSKSTHAEINPPQATKLSETPAPKIVSAIAAPKSGLTPSSAGSGSASAPAPARDPKPSVSNEGRSPAFTSDAGNETAIVANSAPRTSSDTMPAQVPLFTFGGTIGSDAEPSQSGSKKIFLMVAALVLIAAGSYAAWTRWGHSSPSETVPTQVAARPTTAPATVPQSAHNAAPVATPSASAQSIPDSASPAQPTGSAKPSSDSQIATNAGKAAARPSKEKDFAGVDSSKPSASTVAANKVAPTSDTAEPIVIKKGLSKPAPSPAANDAPALSITNLASAGNTAPLPDLMGSSKVATPVLQKLNISQGVSRGLLVKQVQPVYPQNSLRLHTEGSVELLATISKNGDITAVKILKGDSQLAQAAVTAVKQWKYKPYLLNGEPVEIQTEVTINFKLPR